MEPRRTGISDDDAKLIADYLNAEYSPFIYKQTQHCWKKEAVSYQIVRQYRKLGLIEQDPIVVFRLSSRDGEEKFSKILEMTKGFFEKNFPNAYFLRKTPMIFT